MIFWGLVSSVLALLSLFLLHLLCSLPLAFRVKTQHVSQNIRINYKVNTRSCVHLVLEQQYQFLDGRTDEDIKRDRRCEKYLFSYFLSFQLHAEPRLIVSKGYKDVSQQLKQMLRDNMCVSKGGREIDCLL